MVLMVMFTERDNAAAVEHTFNFLRSGEASRKKVEKELDFKRGKYVLYRCLLMTACISPV